ncbi:MAG: cation diffusion facilitator family transporter [Erysipelotrichaceae bacterium]|nr:cation diffusion facilitator family transporter [Erysipelotrichaceae bacterium]
MFNQICRRFIPEYENTRDIKVRERYGTVFSVFSIIGNIILVIIKLIIAFISNSVAIKTDAFNNLSDLGSNLATLIGFKISGKHADADHPYGHGRMEYVSGLIVSFLILYMGFEAIKESVIKIFNPEDLVNNNTTFIVLILSIGIKYVMGLVNSKAGEKIDSETLKAAGQDSRNDCMVTLATLVSLLIYHFFNISIDAYVGAVVSLLVLKSGVEIFKGMLDLVLGKAPDKELVKEMESIVCSYPHVKGIHDMILHDYGPNGKIMSLHAEVDSECDILEIHDEIDNIELYIKENYGILTTIHMDPINMNDEETNILREKVLEAVKSINNEYKIHDFRMVKGQSHTNLIFDVLIPSDDEISDEKLTELIKEKISLIDETYRIVIQIDHSYV